MFDYLHAVRMRVHEKRCRLHDDNNRPTNNRETVVCNVAGYLIEEWRRRPVIYCRLTRTISNSIHNF